MTDWHTVIVDIVLIVAVIALGLVILLAWLGPYVQKYWFTSGFGGNINPTYVDFDNALKCAYYRCTKGCDSNEVTSMSATWKDPQTQNQVSCADYCTAGQSICNDDSAKNPVRVANAQSEVVLDQGKLNSLYGTNCIVSTDFTPSDNSNGIDWGAILQGKIASLSSSLTALYNLITKLKLADIRLVVLTDSSVIEQNNLNNQQTSCYISGNQIGGNAYSTVQITTGNYQIYMGHSENVLGRADEIIISPYQKIGQTTSSTSSSSSLSTSSSTAT